MRDRTAYPAHLPTRRNVLRMLAATGVGVPLLSACAENVSQDSGGGGGDKSLDQVDMKVPAKYKDRKTKVALWHSMGDANGKALDGLIEEFNQSQEEIYVGSQFQGDYHQMSTKLTAALRAGTIPDVVQLADTFWGRYLLNDVLEPLAGYLDDEINRDHYIETLYDEGLVGDDLYWLSFARSTPLFYYNKDQFAQAGLPDRGPETWTELSEWAPELAKIKVGKKPLKAHAFNAADDWQFMASVWQFGGTLSEGLEVTIDEGGAVDAAEWQHRFIFDDKYAYMAQSSGTDFAAGVAATAMTSTGALRGIYDTSKFDVGAAFLPREVAQGVPSGGNGFCLLKGAAQDRKDAAFQVLKFLATPENSAKWTLATGYLPIVKGATEVPELAKTLADDPNFSIALEQLPDAQESDAIRSYLPNGTNIIIKGIQQIYSSAREDPQSVLSDVADELRRGVENIQASYDKYFG